jgi:hypothetical protein
MMTQELCVCCLGVYKEIGKWQRASAWLRVTWYLCIICCKFIKFKLLFFCDKCCFLLYTSNVIMLFKAKYRIKYLKVKGSNKRKIEYGELYNLCNSLKLYNLCNLLKLYNLCNSLKLYNLCNSLKLYNLCNSLKPSLWSSNYWVFDGSGMYRAWGRD